MGDCRHQSGDIGVVRYNQGDCLGSFVDNAGYRGAGEVEGRNSFGFRGLDIPFNWITDRVVFGIFYTESEAAGAAFCRRS